jgi:hypothetical protein
VSKVIRPLSKTPGVRVQTNIVLIRPEGAILNLRSGEAGLVEIEVPESLRTFPLTCLEQKSLCARAKTPVKRLLALGDVYSDGGKSIEFALIYMSALAHSARMMNEVPDVVIVLRPDVAIIGRLWIRWRVLSLAIKTRAQQPEIQAPAWGSFGGVNDRFAVMSGRLAERHLGRVENVDAWVRIGKPFDPEKFLALSLEGTRIKRSIYTPMFRIRIGGRLETADRSFFETPAIIARLRDSLLKTAQTLRSVFSRTR